MDGFMSPIRPSASPKISVSGEINENNQNNSNFKIQKKTTSATEKNFMSPTISAASKAVIPRKKILTERNESSELIFSDTPVPKTPDSDLNPSFASLGNGSSKDLLSPIMGLCSSRFDDEDDDVGEQKTFVPDSSSRPYDPLTNYLSPRPKFLRYNPNRRHEVLLHRQNGTDDSKDGVSSAQKRVSFDSKKSIVEEETSASASGSSSSQDGSELEEEVEEVEERDEDEDEDEDEVEEEEERVCNLKSVFNTLLVFAVLVLSTLYISSMNSPTPPPALQAISSLKNEFLKIRNPVIAAVSLKNLESGKVEFLGQCVEKEEGFVEVSLGESDELVDARKNMEVVENSDELSDEMFEQNGGESEVIEMVGESEEGEIKWGVSDLLVESNVVEEETEAPEKFEFFSLQDIGSDALIPSEKEEENDDGGFNDEIVVEEDGQVTVEDISKEGDEKENVFENGLEGESEDSESEIKNLDGEANSMDGVDEQIETISIDKAVIIGVCTFLAIVASLVLVIQFKRKRTSLKTSSLQELCSEPVTAVNNSSVVLDESHEEKHIEKVDSFVTPSRSMTHSSEEASKEFYQSRAPTVELLGEFEVGEVSSNSLRSCRRKNRMLEVDLSNYSISQDYNHSWSKAQSVPVHAKQQPLSEFSAMDPPSSYGSFTAERKILNKEDGRDGVVVRKKATTTTPVRRSSRILNRGGVKSP